MLNASQAVGQSSELVFQLWGDFCLFSCHVCFYHAFAAHYMLSSQQCLRRVACHKIRHIMPEIS